MAELNDDARFVATKLLTILDLALVSTDLKMYMSAAENTADILVSSSVLTSSKMR